MPRGRKPKEVVEGAVEKVGKAKEVKFLKDLYGDFKDTMGEVFGDAEGVFKKHKLLVIVAFIGFLLYRNKQFTIEQFVNRLEAKLGKDRSY